MFAAKLKRMFILSTIIAVVGSLAGFVVSFAYNLPSGAMITVALVAMFLIMKVFKYISIRQKRNV